MGAIKKMEAARVNARAEMQKAKRAVKAANEPDSTRTEFYDFMARATEHAIEARDEAERFLRAIEEFEAEEGTTRKFPVFNPETGEIEKVNDGEH